ncbi:MAG: DNA repair protein RecN, partial [Angelakisella sp.]
MLSQLYIENIAVIQRASINLEAGLNVFTGETGAGKTILISAINAVLGGRTYKDIIRSGESKALVSAVFTDISAETEAQITALGFSSEGGQLMVSRELDIEGKGGCRINGRPATTALLRQVAELLIDIHGQNDSRELLSADRHMTFIDGFGEHDNLLDDYKKAYADLCVVREKLSATQVEDSYKLQRQDILQYQIDEIAAADLTMGEEEELTAQRDMIRNSEKITAALGAIYDLLSGDEETEGMLGGFSLLEDELDTAARYIEELDGYNSRISEVKYELEELSSTVRNCLDEYNFDPRQLDSIESRLDIISKLERKYGENIEAVLAYYDKIIEEMDSLIFSDREVERLRTEETKLLKVAQELADCLTKQRAEAGERFIALVQQELAYLDMPSVRLSVSMQKKPLSASGQDMLEFLISANPGEEPKPLSKIASGGELSRTMLAIKNVLADKDDIGTIIFDEVDAGVSGRAAYKIGKKLHEVSGNRQILCVTHLAPVAAFGDHHLRIYKTVENQRTYT